MSCSGFREQIASGKVGFAELASKESDCSSAKRGGDLGPFGRGQMQRKYIKPLIDVHVELFFLFCKGAFEEAT